MSKNKRVTSYDVAREAGVSQSAVSRVFRPGVSVSEKTREKVLKTADRLGYRPNAIARMLINQSSGMIAVIVSSRANLNFPDVLSLLNKQIALHNKRVLLFTLDEAEQLDGVIEQILTYQVDGVVALTAHFEVESVKQFAQHNIPVVLYNREVPDHSVSSVCCNHDQGLKMLVDLLVRHHHRRYLIVAGPQDSDVATARLTGAQKALLQHGIDNVPVVRGDYSYESGQQALHSHLQNAMAPTAVICANDAMAIGVIDEAREKQQLRVPEDLSVVGFDGISASAWYSYRLTTVSQPTSYMTKAAVDTLVNLIENPHNPPESRYWPGTLIEGNSVATARSEDE
ncbi:LacI family DNA-binding transcriptional regulator [Lacimicrobium alkaliphilum]|uniref:Transcriptional regulator n=1 Tax=Lacimicrobium alkaliphilum TaxID=1526571 RepID=A0ABQ1R8N1_9ALTE|nr:LacI family DNA-binding transcriptional regulator [Lacimicrobium alkaliphilum]GGD58398.1 transcriptional regulator [Lacimicrobium alkaliphilum]